MENLRLFKIPSILIVLLFFFSCQKKTEEQIEPDFSVAACKIDFFEDEQNKYEFRFENGLIESFVVNSKLWVGEVENYKYIYDSQGRLLKEIFDFVEGDDHENFTYIYLEYDNQGRISKEVYTEPTGNGDRYGIETIIEYNEENLPANRKIFHYGTDELYYEAHFEYENGNEARYYITLDGEKFLYREQEYDLENEIPQNLIKIPYFYNLFGDLIFKNKNLIKKISYYNGAVFNLEYTFDEYKKLVKIVAEGTDISASYSCN
jgi:hypothetical protein